MNVVSQMKAEGAALVLRVWEVPDSFELRPEEDWVEQRQPAPLGLPPLPATTIR